MNTNGNLHQTRLRRKYTFAALAVLASGIASRVINTNHLLFDKYLGDALYAILIYLIFRIIFADQRIGLHAAIAMLLVFAIELFQLTGIPLAMRTRENDFLRILSIALGTKFQGLDVLAYALGVLSAQTVDRFQWKRSQSLQVTESSKIV